MIMHQHCHVLKMVDIPLGSCRPVKLLPSVAFWLLLGLVWLFLDSEWSLGACGLYTDKTDIYAGTYGIFALRKR